MTGGTRRKGGAPAANAPAAQQRLEQLARARSMMAQCNRALVRAEAEPELLRDMCRIVVESGGYRMAWVGLLHDDAARTIQPAASAGTGVDYLEKRPFHADERRGGGGPTGLAVRTRQPAAVQDMVNTSTSASAEIRRLAVERGFHAQVALPLITDGKVLGVLGLFAAQPTAFDAEEIALLQELADDLAFGMRSLRTRQALRDTERRFESTFSQAGVGLAQIALDGRFLRVNDKLCEFFRGTREDLVGSTFQALTLPEDLPPNYPVRERLLAGEPYVTFEKRYRRLDGEIMWAHVTVSLAHAADGTPEYFINVVQDITGKKRTEEALHRFRGAMDASADMVFLIDPQKIRYVDVNDAACRVLGYTREELLALDPSELIRRPHEAMRRSLDGLLAGESGSAFVRRDCVCKDGTVVPVEASRRVLETSVGPLIVSTCRDMRERLAAERALQLERTRSERSLQAYATQQKLLASFGQIALTTTSLDTLLDQAVDLVTAMLGEPFGKILQLTPDDQALILKASRGYEPQWLGQRVAARGQSHARVALEHNEPVVVEDLDTELRFEPSELLRAHGVKSGVEVTIGNAERPYGVIGVHSPRARSYSALETSLVSGIANMLGAAIERRRAEEQLAFLAQFDTLTHLPNRNLLRDRLDQSVQHARRNGWRMGVMFVDLDRFKIVNDTLGHTFGDKLLTQVAERLRGCVRQGDTVGRLGGDEFAVVLSSLTRAQDAAIVATKLISALSEPFDIDGRPTYVSASVGIATYPDDGADPESLLKNADTAMYAAKERGRDNYQFYVADLNERAMRRLQLETLLRGALERSEFILHYQPKANLRTGEISGFEALLRWKHPERGLVPPGEFVPILEDTGLVVPVGDWVLKAAAAQIGEWQALGLAPVPIAVNISGRQFTDGQFDARVRDIVQAAGIDASLIEIEITESMLMHDPEEAIGTLERLKAAGIRLSVDDFGTGYSSLAYLQRFPIDALKIDRAFVKEVRRRRGDAQIAVAIIDLAHNLELEVVAEGVEDAGQAEFLRDNDCDHLQGYWYAAPLDAAAATTALARGLSLPPFVADDSAAG